MMIKKFINSQSLFFVLLCLSASVFTACYQNDDLPVMEEGEGYLSLRNVEISFETNEVSTRSSIQFPSVSELTIQIKNESTDEIIVCNPNTTTYKLDPGSYLIYASYGEDVCGTTPYLYGETSFTIQRAATTNVSLTASLAGAIVHPAISQDLLLHYASYQLSVNDNNSFYEVNNDEDFYVPAGKNYTLNFSGTNQIGESNSTNWNLNGLKPKTRYVINCNPVLPSFVLPEQQEYNAWSKFIYINPMTASDMLSMPEMADKVISNIVYEASSNGTDWTPATFENNKWVIKGLNPSTTYTLRSRFGEVLSSNTYTLTTENAQSLQNGDMESWTETKVYGGNGTFSGAIYCDYVTGWATHNERTINGASGASGFNNYGVNWRWCSNTVWTTDCTNGSKAAEIITMAFYNKKVVGAWSRSEVLSYTKNNGTVHHGYLFLGTYNLSSDSYTLGVAHASRPVSLSFDYKYAPIDNDNCVVKAIVYDENNTEIATIGEFNSGQQDNYQTKTIIFDYNDMAAKAAYVSVFFQSGQTTDITNMVLSEGSYTMTPFVRDRVIGSVLKIDNVVLNYE